MVSDQYRYEPVAHHPPRRGLHAPHDTPGTLFVQRNDYAQTTFKHRLRSQASPHTFASHERNQRPLKTWHARCPRDQDPQQSPTMSHRLLRAPCCQRKGLGFRIAMWLARGCRSSLSVASMLAKGPISGKCRTGRTKTASCVHGARRSQLNDCG